MAKTKIKKGQKLSCIPCGREVIVDSCDTSVRTIWCCEKPMKKGTSLKKKAKRR